MRPATARVDRARKLLTEAIDLLRESEGGRLPAAPGGRMLGGDLVLARIPQGQRNTLAVTWSTDESRAWLRLRVFRRFPDGEVPLAGVGLDVPAPQLAPLAAALVHALDLECERLERQPGHARPGVASHR